MVGLVEHRDLDTRRATRHRARAGRSGGPGVATTRSTPRLERVDLLAVGRAAEDAATASGRAPGRAGASASATCIASSRVGTSTRARGALRLRVAPAGASRASIGRPKPASCRSRSGARPSTSRPASASGRARGLDRRTAPSMPRVLSAVTSASGRPSSAKVTIGRRRLRHREVEQPLRARRRPRPSARAIGWICWRRGWGDGARTDDRAWRRAGGPADAAGRGG